MLRNFLYFAIVVFGFADNSFCYKPLIESGQISDPFYQVCKIISESKNISLLTTRKDIKAWNDWAQHHLLRPSDSDHQDIINQPRYPEHNKLLPLFRELELVDEKWPSQQYYDIWIIFGGSIWDTRERMAYVQKLWKAGVRTKQIIYINGLRKLHTAESFEQILNTKNVTLPNRLAWVPPKSSPHYQHEMAGIIWDQIIDDQELKTKLEIKTIKAKSESQRANTEDTVIDLFQNYDDLTSYLFISNAPYGPFQGEIVNKVKSENSIDGYVETVSSGTMRTITTIPYLDTLARRLYTINQQTAK